MEITGCWENGAISFWENGTVIRKSVQFWNCSKSAKLGHIGRPTLTLAPLTLGLPSEGANGPSNLGPRDFQLPLIHQASPVSGRAGPNEIQPERRLLEDPMDRMRSYPLISNLNLIDSF